MSTDDTTTNPTPSPDGRSAYSRRVLLAAAGAVGVAATAATVIGVSASSPARSDAATTGAAGSADTAAADEDGAIVVHVRDLAAGTLDVFQGTEYRQLRHPELAAQLAAVARS